MTTGGETRPEKNSVCSIWSCGTQWQAQRRSLHRVCQSPTKHRNHHRLPQRWTAHIERLHQALPGGPEQHCQSGGTGREYSGATGTAWQVVPYQR